MWRRKRRSWRARGTASQSVRAAVLVRGRVRRLECGSGYRAALWNLAVLCAGGEYFRDSAGDEVPGPSF